MHNLEVWFGKISVRSNYMRGQRWGLLQQIFISESGKRRVATGYRPFKKRTLPLVEGKRKGRAEIT